MAECKHQQKIVVVISVSDHSASFAELQLNEVRLGLGGGLGSKSKLALD